MNPFMSRELAGERIRDLRDEAARAGRKRSDKSSGEGDRVEGLTLRRFAERDIDAIRRLAALDQKPVPTGGVLVAELAGDLVAALPLDDGQAALADPFRPTAEIVELLRVRARQLRESDGTARAAHPLWTRAHAPLRKLA